MTDKQFRNIKLMLYAILITITLGFALHLGGCMKVEIDAPAGTIKASSFLKDINLSEIYLDVVDPNQFTLWLTDYESDAKNSVWRFNPITRQFEIVVEGGEVE